MSSEVDRPRKRSTAAADANRSGVVVASDLGSSGCKTAMVSLSGDVLATATRTYETEHPRTGWAQQDPQDWYDAFCATVREVLAALPGFDPTAVRGVGIVGVTHTAVLLDSDGRPVAPSILMFDSRSHDDASAIRDAYGDEVRRRTLHDASPMWTWPQLRWMRRSMPDEWARVRSILFAKDYVRHRLAPSPLTDVIDAAGSLLFDPIANQWVDAFIEDLALPGTALPEVVDPCAVVGTVSAQGHADTGLPRGVSVVAGTTDTASEVLGSGAVTPGAGVVKLASVGRIALVHEQPVLPSDGILNYRHVLEGLWYPGTACKYAAGAFRWAGTSLWGAVMPPGRYPQMDAAASAVPPGSRGVMFLPHLGGQWAPVWDELMRGAWLGLTTRHSTADLTRAVLEGVAFALRDALASFPAPPAHDAVLRLIGRGARSPLWGDIVATVLGRPLVVPRQPEALLGAAAVTAMGVDSLPRDHGAGVANWLSSGREIVPDAAGAELYGELYGIYVQASAAMTEVSHRLDVMDRRTDEPGVTV